MANLDINVAEFERIYPTENDICFSPYNGVNGSEVNYSKNLHWRNPRNCILSALDGFGNPTDVAGFVCTDGGGAIVNVSRGRAYIEGRYVELNTGAVIPVTVDTDKDTYLYLQLNISGSVQVTPPARFITIGVAHGAVHSKVANAVLLAKIVTNATPIITSITDMRCAQFRDATTLYVPFGAFPGFGPATPAGDLRVPTYSGKYACLTAYCLGFVSALVGIGTLTVRATGPNGFVDQLQVLPIFTATTIAGMKKFPIFINIPTDIGRYDNDYVIIQLRPSGAILRVGTCSDVTNVVSYQDVSSLANFSEWGAKA
jgi:hypothetical protein